MSHHHTHDDSEFSRLMKELQKQPLGATGNYPDGKLTENDEGELAFEIGNLNNRVVINFHKPVKSLGMTKQQALDLANCIIGQAASLK